MEKIEETIDNIYSKNLKLADELIEDRRERSRAAIEWTVDDAEHVVTKYLKEKFLKTS